MRLPAWLPLVLAVGSACGGGGTPGWGGGSSYGAGSDAGQASSSGSGSSSGTGSGSTGSPTSSSSGSTSSSSSGSGSSTSSGSSGSTGSSGTGDSGADGGGSSGGSPEGGAPAGKRVIYYDQTQYDQGTYVSLAPLFSTLNPSTHKPYVTDVMIAAFHLGVMSDSTLIHLNNNAPSDAMFTTLWQETAMLQSRGVTVRLMLGGAGKGSYANALFADWNTFYPALKQTLTTYKFDGIDLDIEESVALAQVQQLIDQLSADFGPSFVITLAPVASALVGGKNLSGFDYGQLEQSPEGAKVAWYNTQFYSMLGSLATTANYDSIISAGFSPRKIVAGMLTNPANGTGYVDVNTVANTVTQLAQAYPGFAGVDGWEYFDANPGGTAHPEQWAALMANAMP